MPRVRGGGGRGRAGGGGGGGRGHGTAHGARRRGGSDARRGDSRGAAPSPAAAGDGIGRVAARALRQRDVRQLLEGIGTPAPAEFRPDPFQLQALAALEREDVLVTAPTGSGKTWIAREEIRRLLDAGRRAWYTSPLKALTNSKYHEFAEAFGADRVGILTGDRKENGDAPLVVGTTEVYRNQLFDAMREGRDLRADLVILDEAHYLADEERGHVWEEAIILTPPRVRLLLLSATVGNASEFAAWMEEVRGVRCAVVARPGARPVPLRAAFLYPEGQIAPLFDDSNRFNQEIANYLQHAGARDGRPPHSRFGERREPRHTSRMNIPEMPPGSLLAALGSYELLPAIVFLPTRRRCDEAATEAALGRRDSDSSRRDARRALMKSLAESHPEIRRHRHWDVTLRGGVASHHAGHLPAWKLCVEKLMAAGLLDAIFATATVAAGVDFPARTVALTNIDVRTGRGWRPLTASELQQMTGRAGRRGRDRVGFIVAAPGMHQEPQRLATLLQSPPDPLESQFRATYTTLLNLLDAYGDFAHVRDIASRSFAHRETLERIARLERERAEAERRIGERLREAGCDLPPAVARGLERLASARDRLLTATPQTNFEVYLAWLDEVVTPGRVVGIGRGSKRLVFVTERREGAFSGVREDGRRATYTLDRIGRVFSEVYPRTENAREAAFADVRGRRVAPLDEPRLRDARAQSDEAVTLINDLMDELSTPSPRRGRARRGDDGEPLDAAARTACEEALWSVVREAASVEQLERRAEVLRGEVWQPFERRARVLARFGYLDFARERVTERGRWLADLRLDRPLLVGQAIEKNLFAELDAPRAAAIVAALAADAERDFGQLELDDALVTALAQFERIAFEVGSAEWQEELEPAPEMNFSAAAAAARWARGASWEALVRETRAEEGDLFRMLSRTGESLIQISNLRDAHPRAASVAEEAASAVLREPVRSDDVP